MTEYINKEELTNYIKRIERKLQGGSVFPVSPERIDEFSTIDIVHCYKCKHYEKYTEHTGFCNHFVVNGERLAMEYDWFCADGERRKDG